jgi:predicted HTH domain antitoxin
MTKRAKYVTKSIRLTEDEARELAALVADEAISESALMRQWVMRSMRQERIERAVAAYQRDEVDLREGASMAGVPIGVFVDALSERHVAMVRDPTIFRRELEDLMGAFGGPDALAAVREAFAPETATTGAP